MSVWQDAPTYDDVPATFANAADLFVRAAGCWWWGHTGLELYPDFEGDRYRRSCDRCGRRWKKAAPTADQAVQEGQTDER